jgi:hypothetical protein
MVERLTNYFLSEPGKITGLGRKFAYCGALLLLAGAIGQFATRTTNILPTLTHQAESTKMLADIYPTLPLWWVPESFVGAISSIVILIFGLALVSCGRRVDYFLRT